MASDDLHRALLAAVSPPAGTPLTDLDPNAWLAALRAVVELHVPDAVWPSCNHCLHGWPCSTIRTIAEALGVTEGAQDRER